VQSGFRLSDYCHHPFAAYFFHLKGNYELVVAARRSVVAVTFMKP
jgi:hypothetical protein